MNRMIRVLPALLILAAPALAALSNPPPTPSNYGGYYDLSDPTAMAYLTTQLTAVGITKDQFASLYAGLAAAPAIYQRANAKGIVIPQVVMKAEGTQLEPINLVSPGYSQPNNTISATETSSIPATPYAVANTLGLFANSKQMGASTGAVAVGTGNEVTSALTEPAQAGVSQYQAQGVSTFIYPASVLGAANVQALGLQDTSSVALGLPLGGVFDPTGSTTISNTAPTNVKGNNYMKLCTGRTGGDCDYAYPMNPSGPTIIQMPLNGSVTFPSPIAVNPTTGVPVNAQYDVAIWYPEVGGGCKMPDSVFAKQVTVSGKVLSWNADPGQFGAICSQYPYGSTVTVTYQLTMLIKGTDSSSMPATVTTDQNATSGSTILKLLPLEFVYGCLAKGTAVALEPKAKGAKSRTLPIEKIQAGQIVLGPGGAGLKVSSYWKGPEKDRLYRVSTANGRKVDMTSNHPVPLANGQVRLAKTLSVGDTLTTDKGPSPIAGILRVAAKDTVWNLDLGAPQSSREPIDMARHSFYANGILVGDGRAQSHHTRKHREHPSQVLARLPEHWHNDFYASKLYMASKNKKKK
jgi:hypothetical protein